MAATRNVLISSLMLLLAVGLVFAATASAADLPRRMLPAVAWRNGYSCCWNVCRGSCASLLPARQLSLPRQQPKLADILLLFSVSCYAGLLLKGAHQHIASAWARMQAISTLSAPLWVQCVSVSLAVAPLHCWRGLPGRIPCQGFRYTRAGACPSSWGAASFQQAVAR